MTIRFGLAGLQHPHFEYLLTEIAKRPDEVRLVAISDSDPSVREGFRARLMVPAYADHREMLDKAAFERFGSHYHFVSGK